MSAIWGSISFQNTLPDNTEKALQSYYETNCKIDRFEHLWHQDAYFGCGIQYITPEAANEQLPYYDSSQQVLFTADCILDNRSELMNALDITDTSLPDGTLILRAYLKWGMECVNHLRGLYSFAIYDKQQTCLYLVADHVSSRCLYYYRSDHQITFSTLLTPIRKLHPKIKTNELYIRDFLTAPGMMPNISSIETPYEHVYKLNPGTYLKITENTLEEISYWSPSLPLTNCACKTPKEYGSYFRALFTECVIDALRTNGNIGITFSSGLDSASVGALAATHLRAQDQLLYAYTFVPFEETPPDRNRNNVHDETKDVQKIAQMHPNIITHFLNNHGKNCIDDLPQDVSIMEIPYKAQPNLPNLFEIYREASKNGCKIVLNGQMGNSTISFGYINHILYDLYHKKKYFTFLRYLNRHCKIVKMSRKHALMECIKYFQHLLTEEKNNVFTYSPTNPFLSHSIISEYPMEERYRQNNISWKMILSDQKKYRQDLYHKPMFTYLGELQTKAGLAHGIILRDPTKDIRMLNFCYHLPYHLFAYKGTPRWLVRNHMRDLLPRDLLDDWLRYGVQNSDCHKRIMRDWQQLCPQFKARLTSTLLQPYVNPDRIQRYFTECSSELTPEKEEETFYLIVLSLLHEHLQQSS